jgi:hypothetical protein
MSSALSNHIKTASPADDDADKHTPFRCVQADRIGQVLAELDDLKAAMLTLANGQVRMEAKLDAIAIKQHDEDVAERTLSEVESDLAKKAREKREHAKTTLEVVKNVLTIAALLGADRLITYLGAHWH